MKTMLILAGLWIGLSLCIADAQVIKNPLLDYYQSAKAGVSATEDETHYTPQTPIYYFEGDLITLEYQMDSSDITHLKATMDKVIAVGATITTTNFAKLYPDLKDDLTNEETNVLPNVTAAMAASKQGKGNTTGQHLTYLTHLQAAELDGLIH